MNLVLTKTRGRIGILGRVAVYADFTQQDKDSFATNTRHQQPSKFLSVYSSTQILWDITQTKPVENQKLEQDKSTKNYQRDIPSKEKSQ